MNSDQQLKVLHCLAGLPRGGIETWLMNLVRQRLPDWRVDFMVNTLPGAAGDYEAEALASGCRIHYAPRATKFILRLQALGLFPADHSLRRVLERECYDVVHVHGNEFNGDSMRIAHAIGVPVRVAHCHHTVLARGKKGLEMAIREMRRRTVDRSRLLRHATNLVACGRDAGRFMLGSKWDNEPRAQVVYCGILLSAFENAIATSCRIALLDRFRLPSDSIVIGHAGSMGPSPVKNHEFLVRVFAEVSKRDSRYHLVMAGDGPLRPQIEQQVQDLGLAGRVRMPGIVRDVPALMAHLFDAHVMPSFAEGLPVAAIEAVAGGVFTVLADTITDELAEHLPGRTKRLSLSAPLSTWADHIERAISKREAAADGLARVRKSPFTIENSAQALLEMYRRQLAVGP